MRRNHRCDLELVREYPADGAEVFNDPSAISVPASPDKQSRFRARCLVVVSRIDRNDILGACELKFLENAFNPSEL